MTGRISAFLLLFLAPLIVHSEHLVGGIISYEHISGNTYEVTLTVYRDCFSSGAPFDSPDTQNGSAVIGIFTGDNNYHSSFVMGYPTVTTIDPALSGLCEDVGAPACVEEGVYVKTVILPPNSNGYTLVYQRCCRNGTILNIESPGDTGNTYTAFIPPGPIVEDNSCPTFDNFPPVGLCLNKSLVFDHVATDIDGDSLVYSFCNPFAGASTFDPQPEVPSNPEYQEVVWATGYSTEYQIASSPAFSIDSETGLLTGTPTEQGQFVIGICVQEFREGVFISEVRRDFQFNVVLCPDQPLASFDEFTTGSECTNEVSFENNSEDADTYLWNFGDGNTSNDFTPTHTYDVGGTYNVSLTVTSGNCDDIQELEVTLNGLPTPLFEESQFECINGQETYSFSVTNVNPTDFDYEWNIEGQSSVQTSTNVLTNVEFSTPGEYEISVSAENSFGCIGEDQTTITVNPSPQSSFNVTSGTCQGFSQDFVNTSNNNDISVWDFDFEFAGNTTNEDEISVTFPAVGNYSISLIASGVQVCSDTSYQMITIEEPPFVSIEMPDPQCQVGNSSDFIPSGNFALPAEYSWSIENSAPISNTASSLYNVSVTEAGMHSVELEVTDAVGCSLTFQSFFETIAPLEVGFISDGVGCLPYQAYFNNTTTGGSAVIYEWDFGNGETSNATSPTALYVESGTYNISLTATSTAGCVSSDTYWLPNALTTYPSPAVGFDVNPTEVNIINPQIQILTTVDSVTCEYFVTDGSYYADCNISHVFQDAGTFEITQEVTNEFNCSSNLTRVIDVTGHLFYAPNAITMNDDGVNDFWTPSIIGEIVEYSLVIYTRNGEIVFETDDYTKGWRPEYSHDGQYNFRAVVRDKNSPKVVYTGSFISLR